jgi:hypothetical protein
LEDHEFDAFEENWIDLVDESIANETVRRTSEHSLSLFGDPVLKKRLLVHLVVPTLFVAKKCCWTKPDLCWSLSLIFKDNC